MWKSCSLPVPNMRLYETRAVRGNTSSLTFHFGDVSNLEQFNQNIRISHSNVLGRDEDVLPK